MATACGLGDSGPGQTATRETIKTQVNRAWSIATGNAGARGEDADICQDEIKFCTVNMRSMVDITQRQALAKWAASKGIDVVAIQETKVNVNTKEVHGDYVLLTSSSVDPETRSKVENMRSAGKTVRKEMYDRVREHHGVGFMISSKIMRHTRNVEPIDGRCITMTLRCKTPVSFVNVYGPTADADLQEKRKFYDNVEKAMEPCKDKWMIVVCGDLMRGFTAGKGRITVWLGRTYCKGKCQTRNCPAE